MSRNTYTHLNAKNSAVVLERSLSVITLPFVLGLIALRQLEGTWKQLGQLGESLLQGDRLPILNKRCSSTQNSTDP
jgi:hypothetical protein